MITMVIKGHPTIGNLQAPFEASIVTHGTWVQYSRFLDTAIKFLGKEKSPEDIFKADVDKLKAYLLQKLQYPEARMNSVISAMSSYYRWMIDMGFVYTNPFEKMRGPLRKDVQVIFE